MPAQRPSLPPSKVAQRPNPVLSKPAHQPSPPLSKPPQRPSPPHRPPHAHAISVWRWGTRSRLASRSAWIATACRPPQRLKPLPSNPAQCLRLPPSKAPQRPNPLPSKPAQRLSQPQSRPPRLSPQPCKQPHKPSLPHRPLHAYVMLVWGRATPSRNANRSAWIATACRPPQLLNPLLSKQAQLLRLPPSKGPQRLKPLPSNPAQRLSLPPRPLHAYVLLVWGRATPSRIANRSAWIATACRPPQFLNPPLSEPAQRPSLPPSNLPRRPKPLRSKPAQHPSPPHRPPHAHAISVWRWGTRSTIANRSAWIATAS